MIDLKLDYIFNDVFNLSRRYERVYMPERVCYLSKKEGHGRHIYYDNVVVETHLIRSADEYSHLIVDVTGVKASGFNQEVSMSYSIEYPVVLTLRCERDCIETLSFEGGVSRELRSGDKGYFSWYDGQYLHPEED